MWHLIEDFFRSEPVYEGLSRSGLVIGFDHVLQPHSAGVGLATSD
jgi:hypothetical protein